MMGLHRLMVSAHCRHAIRMVWLRVMRIVLLLRVHSIACVVLLHRLIVGVLSLTRGALLIENAHVSAILAKLTVCSIRAMRVLMLLHVLPMVVHCIGSVWILLLLLASTAENSGEDTLLSLLLLLAGISIGIAIKIIAVLLIIVARKHVLKRMAPGTSASSIVLTVVIVAVRILVVG